MNLAKLVEDRDWQGMADYIWQRYDTAVSPDHATDILLSISYNYDTITHQIGTLEVRLKNRLGQLGYLSPMFTGKDDDPKIAWNELHIFVDGPPEDHGVPSLDESEYPCPRPQPSLEPNYVRSKITEYSKTHKPRAVNKTAHNVARIPEGEEPSQKTS